jgi:predicted transcriptional regulator
MEADTLIINNRDEFAQWAIARANAVLVEQGSNLATAARTGDDNQIADAANALGQSIVDTLLDAFDCLVDSE